MYQRQLFQHAGYNAPLLVGIPLPRSIGRVKRARNGLGDWRFRTWSDTSLYAHEIFVCATKRQQASIAHPRKLRGCPGRKRARAAVPTHPQRADKTLYRLCPYNKADDLAKGMPLCENAAYPFRISIRRWYPRGWRIRRSRAVNADGDAAAAPSKMAAAPCRRSGSGLGEPAGCR